MDTIVLDAYAARSCPVKTHHTFDPTLEKPTTPLDESLRESFQGGSDFRDEVRRRLKHLGIDHCTFELEYDAPEAAGAQPMN